MKVDRSKPIIQRSNTQTMHIKHYVEWNSTHVVSILRSYTPTIQIKHNVEWNSTHVWIEFCCLWLRGPGCKHTTHSLWDTNKTAEKNYISGPMHMVCALFVAWYRSFAPIPFKVISFALGWWYECPTVNKATRKNIGKCVTWMHKNWWYIYHKRKHNKTVCIFYEIYCINLDFSPLESWMIYCQSKFC